ncbi:hypothetical protein [Streptomyces sp. NPDC007063]|uniref:hypothetical protein n=1 Tax=Streptomyces sp. NPDC007063 TaxID=3364772 RepID=UPI0036A68142
MSSKNEYWDARLEIETRGKKAGIDEGELNTLLYAFEAAVLREMADTYKNAGCVRSADELRYMAAGIRPRNWRRLLTHKPEAGGR